MKPSQGIAKSLHASQTGRERFAIVLDMFKTFMRQNSSPDSRQVIACVANPSPTVRKHSQAHRKLFFRDPQNATNIMRYKCDFWQRNCDKITLGDTRTNVARHSHEFLTTVARVSFVLLRIWRDHNVQWDCNYEMVENLRLYHPTLSPTSRKFVASQWDTSPLT